MKKLNTTQLDELCLFFETIDWSNRALYATYMAQTYYYVRHSTRLLAASAAKFHFAEEKAHARFIEHIGEEERHEKLAELDVKALGYRILDIPELPSTKAFYQTQYYLLEHSTPWSLMGHIFALEGLAVKKGLWLYDKVTQLYGPKAGHFLKVHAAEDVDHVEKATQLLNTLSPEVLKVVQEAHDLSCYLHAGIIKDCRHWISQMKVLKAA